MPANTNAFNQLAYIKHNGTISTEGTENVHKQFISIVHSVNENGTQVYNVNRKMQRGISYQCSAKQKVECSMIKNMLPAVFEVNHVIKSRLYIEVTVLGAQ